MKKGLDVYVIPPVAHLELMNEGSRFFCLAQQYKKHESYREFFKQKVREGKWVTLDNGVGDHDPITQEELFEIMFDLMPSEVIPLDTLFNKEETIKNTLNFIEQLELSGLQDRIQILACPQGNTFEEWIECYETFLNDDRIHTIGLSKLAVPWVLSQSKNDTNIARDRNRMFDILKENDLLQKPLHLLGAGEPTEFSYYQNHPMIRSNDSCFSVWQGVNNVLFNDKNYKRIPTPRNYFSLEFDEKQLSLAKQNIEIFKQLINYESH